MITPARVASRSAGVRSPPSDARSATWWTMRSSRDSNATVQLAQAPERVVITIDDGPDVPPSQRDRERGQGTSRHVIPPSLRVDLFDVGI